MLHKSNCATCMVKNRIIFPNYTKALIRVKQRPASSHGSRCNTTRSAPGIQAILEHFAEQLVQRAHQFMARCSRSIKYVQESSVCKTLPHFLAMNTWGNFTLTSGTCGARSTFDSAGPAGTFGNPRLRPIWKLMAMVSHHKQSLKRSNQLTSTVNCGIPTALHLRTCNRAWASKRRNTHGED